MAEATNILLWKNKVWESKVSNTGDLVPVELTKDIAVDLPPVPLASLQGALDAEGLDLDLWQRREAMRASAEVNLHALSDANVRVIREVFAAR